VENERDATAADSPLCLLTAGNWNLKTDVYNNVGFKKYININISINARLSAILLRVIGL